MLTSLWIKNFAIISILDIHFSAGMSSFTGETGAGKSILIDALLLAIGQRSDASLVRQGAKQCEIQAYFSFDEHSEPWKWLEEHELLSDEAPLEVCLRRIISQEGRSKAYINGSPQPLHQLKALSQFLIDVHGQHEHQRLFQHATHRTQLDQFANHDALLAQLSEAFKTYQKTKQDIAYLEQKMLHRSPQHLLDFQIEELTILNCLPDEMDHLSKEHFNLHHAKQYIEHAETLKVMLKGDDQTTGICEQLNHLLQRIHGLSQNDETLKRIHQLLETATIQCQEAANEASHWAHTLFIDPDKLNAIEARMSILHQMARKYHIDVDALPSHLQQLQAEKASVDEEMSSLHHLKQALDQSQQHYHRLSRELSNSRKLAAPKLARAMTNIIHELGMPNATLSIECSTLEHPQAHGQDKIEYVIQTNPGSAPDLLSKIASGGELSRIGLSIHLVTAQQKAATPTLIFDEVDVGISGTIAALVGQRLRELSSQLQVFCITHQPQVAAAAHQHYVVQKNINNAQTFSSIQALSQEARVEEIARMLGGHTIHEQTRSHAKALLEEYS